MRRLILLFPFLLVVSPLAAATRLPQNVVPDHYSIRIAPDLAAETFAGEETIDLTVKEPVDSITMHASDLALHDVYVDGGGKRLAATVSADAPNETVTLKLAETLPPGKAAVHIAFDGKLGQQLRGLYLSRTAKRKYAVTQFESTSARRAFPSFDEPAMKATFDITLVVDNGDTAISNGAIVSDTPAGEGKHAIRFATTPRMSTYLVALLVGDFQCTSGSADDVPIRVCSTPGLENLGGFAMEAAQASIRFFDQYYGIRYPFGKLDLIGIPDFAAGAMENAGAITFRETDLLVDEKSASTLQLKRVAEVVAHEIAHQWFGDLVTMQWWNDIWLNEGFATFMSEKPIEAWKPEWRSDLDRVLQTNEAMMLDSQRSTRPIRTPPGSEPGFGDFGITYGKTASVLRMVEEWIGPDAFRDAIRTYLKKYSWGNAAAEDFWGTMKASSNQPIDAVLQSFIDQPGVPLLHVSATCKGNERQLAITQERLVPGNEKPAAQSWTIPLCAHGEACRVMTKASETMALTAEAPKARSSKLEKRSDAKADRCSSPLFLSRAGAAYFAADYPATTRAALRKHLGSLTSAERIAYNGNEWLLARTMHRDVGDYLSLVRANPRPADRPLVTTIADNLIYLDQRLVNDSNRSAWQRFVKSAVSGLAPATWTAPAGETSEQRIARAYVLWTLGYAARDGRVIAGARSVAEQYMKDPSSVDAVIADRALRLTAISGDQAFFDRVVGQIAAAPTPELSARYRNLLPLFRDPKVAPRAYEYIYSERVRTQDLPIVATAGFSDPATRPAAWAEARARWADVEKRAPGVLGRLAGAAGSFCDAGSRKEVEEWFKQHPTRGGQRALSRSLESIDTCMAFKAAQQKSFDDAIGAK